MGRKGKRIKRKTSANETFITDDDHESPSMKICNITATPCKRDRSERLRPLKVIPTFKTTSTSALECMLVEPDDLVEHDEQNLMIHLI